MMMCQNARQCELGASALRRLAQGNAKYFGNRMWIQNGRGYRPPSAHFTVSFGKKRDSANPFPCPFETPEKGEVSVKVW